MRLFRLVIAFLLSVLLIMTEVARAAPGAFSFTGNLNRARYNHTGTLLNNGMVLIVGGFAGTSAELYNPTTGTFTATGNLNATHSFHTATLLDNGMVLIAGGWDFATGNIASAELYNPATGTFTPTGSM